MFSFRAKQDAQNKGGVIKHEYSLIKGFTYGFCILRLCAQAYLLSNSVEYPDDQVNALESTEHIHVEEDSEVTTQ
jgi:hypothetical protein